MTSGRPPRSSSTASQPPTVTVEQDQHREGRELGATGAPGGGHPDAEDAQRGHVVAVAAQVPGHAGREGEQRDQHAGRGHQDVGAGLVGAGGGPDLLA